LALPFNAMGTHPFRMINKYFIRDAFEQGGARGKNIIANPMNF